MEKQIKTTENAECPEATSPQREEFHQRRGKSRDAELAERERNYLAYHAASDHAHPVFHLIIKSEGRGGTPAT